VGKSYRKEKGDKPRKVKISDNRRNSEGKNLARVHAR
jgi:hypothetical protein